jgi:hypothetical protein|tara:strand:- start:134 stop:241 length:108 start_codon:yes stop_codon:yes gene_type:complete
MAVIGNRTCQKKLFRLLEVESNLFAVATQKPEATH